MGFAVLGLAWLVSVVEWLRTNDAVRWRCGKSLFLLGAVCTLATLVTPFHYRLYLVVWEYATQTGALRLVMELQPPNLVEWFNWPLIAMVLAASACIAIRGYRLWDMVLLGSGLFFSLRMQRDLWYGVLTAGAVILHEKGEHDEDNRSSEFTAWQLAIIAIAALAIVRAAWVAGLSQGKTPESCHKELYPVNAAVFVRESNLAGPIFNDFDWGGYLIWALPDHPVAIDGRTNFYGEARLEQSRKTWAGESGWEDNPILQKAQVVIAPKKRKDKEFPLTDFLRARQDTWAIKYEDDIAVVFVRIKAPRP
jgi:hypothetical protein